MILNSLVKYYEALPEDESFTKPGYCTAGVSYALVISPEGRLTSVESLKHEEQRGKKTALVPSELIVPEQKVRSSGIRSNFLCENSAYMLGIDKKGKPEHSRDCFSAAAELHKKILSGVDDPDARAVIAYFDSWNPDKISDYPFLEPLLDDMLAGANMVFRNENHRFIHSGAEIRKAWEKYLDSDESGVSGRCLVTGDETEIAVLHGKIKGVPGAQAFGVNLVSFNAQAFESYGNDKSQGLNAPVGKYAAYAYTTALNRLISDRRYVKILGDTNVVFWSEDGNETSRDWFNQEVFEGIKDENGELKSIFRAVMQGKPIETDKINSDASFCVLGLSVNAARLSVRFFYRSTFGSFLENIAKHYKRLEIDKPSWESEYLTPYWLLDKTAPPASKAKAVSPILAGAVMRSILNDFPYPEALYNAVLLRIRADRDISPGRAAIIKACLLKNSKNAKIKEEITVSLNESLNNKAYLLGRLFSLLEKAQTDANPTVKTTIKDRYFTSACATPQLVFPYLIKLSNHHNAKAEYGDYTERSIRMLIDRLDQSPFPARLNNEDQGYFIQGYYQQTQQRFIKKDKTNENESESEVKENV